ncbi:MAG: thioredoxin family protein [Acetobacteraceae bacterium]|nr:thioredoxin family protein [Acetobacteraceae bacterium]
MTMRRFAILPAMLLALVGAAFASAHPARALESRPAVSAQAEVRLVAEQDAVAPGTELRVGLLLRLTPGWHTYWKNPGDAGAPAEITFSLPDGATAGPIAWPLPRRLPQGPLVAFGYTDEVLLPLTISLPAGLAQGRSLPIEAAASWLVCAEICIPEEANFRLELPVAAAGRADPAQTPRFAAADAARPRASPFRASAGFAGSQGGLRLEGSALSPASVAEAFFFPAGWGVLDNAAAQPARIEDGALVLALARGEATMPGRLDGVLALADPNGRRVGFEIEAPIEAALPAGTPAPAAGSAAPGRLAGLWQAVLFAALGGLILNLMPCVFPILAMKAFALARMGGAEQRLVRAHAASYTAGVVLGFLAVGGVLLALRAGGAAAGWGVQFTEPAFLAAMAWLMLLIGLNLSGVFAVGRAVNAGAGLAAGGGHFGSFATGALAVAVATPCTAPFMAAALGAALAMPPWQALAVFAALGLGMAAPYGLLGLFPGAARLLPRPGAWMERLKQGLAFPMYAAAAWLAWVLSQVGGPDALAVGLGGAIAVALSAALYGVAQQGASGWLRAGAILPGLAALAVLAGIGAGPAPPPLAARANGAEPWSAARVAELQADGRFVFVNFTAAWCITCKVNEQVALNREAVQAAFARANVAYLKGDWTRGDPAIGAVLRLHQREGVPLYLLYPAGGGAARVLPEILTEGIVLEALAATRIAGVR